MTIATAQPNLFDFFDAPTLSSSQMPSAIQGPDMMPADTTTEPMLDSSALQINLQPSAPISPAPDGFPVRATRTRKNAERISTQLEALDPQRKKRRPSTAVPATIFSPELAALMTAGLQLETMTVQQAWEVYQSLPRGGDKPGKNAERSASDLGNKKRALQDAALGHSGIDDLSKVPLSFLARDHDEINEDLMRGLTLRLGCSPEPKKASNLRSDLKTVRMVLTPLLNLPALAPKAALLQRTVQKGRWQRGIRGDQWPARLRAEFNAMAAAYTDPNYAGPGYRFTRGQRQRKRLISLQNISTRFNRLVDFLVNVEGLDDPTLLDLVSLERLPRFKRWYFEQVTQGGYDQYQHTCSGLAKTAAYLEAIGVLQSGFSPNSEHPDAPWIQFATDGQTTMQEGVDSHQKVGLEELPLRTPEELALLARRCQVQPPRTVDGRAPSSRQLFQRLFAAIFYGLGIYMPLRGRNWREMQWGKNLSQRADGGWQVKFSGDELKNSRYGKKGRTYLLALPAEAAKWILWWRDQLRVFVGDDFEQKCPLVFPMLSTLTDEENEYRWITMSHKYLIRCVDDAALEGIGQRFRPHMIRHCVATAIVSSGRIEDAQQAATLLGDTLKTVLDTYFKPDEQKLLDKGYYARLAALS